MNEELKIKDIKSAIKANPPIVQRGNFLYRSYILEGIEPYQMIGDILNISGELFLTGKIVTDLYNDRVPINRETVLLFYPELWLTPSKQAIWLQKIEKIKADKVAVVSNSPLLFSGLSRGEIFTFTIEKKK